MLHFDNFFAAVVVVLPFFRYATLFCRSSGTAERNKQHPTAERNMQHPGIPEQQTHFFKLYVYILKKKRLEESKEKKRRLTSKRRFAARR
jgi:hypothetical protein